MCITIMMIKQNEKIRNRDVEYYHENKPYVMSIVRMIMEQLQFVMCTDNESFHHHNHKS